MWDFGFYSPETDYTTWEHRRFFQMFIRVVIPLTYVVGVLAIAGAAAASMTSEHEDDTWMSLTSH